MAKKYGKTEQGNKLAESRKILFVCIENAGRSQMAEAFAKKHRLTATSSGTMPSSSVNPIVVEAMKEKGVDLSSNVPKTLTVDMIEAADVVVTMGCSVEQVCPKPMIAQMQKKLIDWHLDDPKGKPLDAVRGIRDEIEERVKALASSTLLSAVILAGGSGTRLPGKCFRKLGDRELVVHVFGKVSQVVDEIIVTVKDEEQALRIQQLIPRARVVFDEAEVQTPLAGFLAGLRAARAPYVFAAGCDTPFLEPPIIQLLFERAIGKDAAIPVIDGQQTQPLCAVYRRDAAMAAAQKTLEMNHMSLMEMLAHLEEIVLVSRDEVSKVDPELITFRNINTDSDLERAESVFRQQN